MRNVLQQSVALDFFAAHWPAQLLQNSTIRCALSPPNNTALKERVFTVGANPARRLTLLNKKEIVIYIAVWRGGERGWPITRCYNAIKSIIDLNFK